jgi:hypothetical protein
MRRLYDRSLPVPRCELLSLRAFDCRVAEVREMLDAGALKIETLVRSGRS